MLSQEFTEVTNGAKSGKIDGIGKRDEVEVRNRFEALTKEDDGQDPVEDEEGKEEKHQEKTREVTKRWSRNASQKKKTRESDTRKGHRAVEVCSEVCWLCEEYDEERLAHTGVGCCCKPKEPDHDEHICIECRSELNHGATLCSRPRSGHAQRSEIS